MNDERIVPISAIYDKLERILKAVEAPKLPNQLNTALALAQGEFETARRSRESLDYNDRYGDLSDVVDASRAYLAKNGLSVTFPISNNTDTGTLLECVLLHSSGQEIRSSMRILPQKNDPRSYASEINFMKRVLYSALVGVCVEGEDDDAHDAMDAYRDAEERRMPLSTKVDAGDSKVPINREQLEDLELELDGDTEIAGKILKSFNIRDLASMPRSKYREAMKTLRLIKENKKR
jgi:hypothetical protein